MAQAAMFGDLREGEWEDIGAKFFAVGTLTCVENGAAGSWFPIVDFPSLVGVMHASTRRLDFDALSALNSYLAVRQKSLGQERVTLGGGTLGGLRLIKNTWVGGPELKEPGT